MKNKIGLCHNKIIFALLMSIAAINLAEDAIAIPAINAANKQVKICTPSTCTPYRANYEKAIANRIITRPSLVLDENQALGLADRAMARGDRNEAARRLAQALVIISESQKPGQGIAGALAIERTLDTDMKNKRGQSLREFLPLFDRIFPTNQNPYR